MKIGELELKWLGHSGFLIKNQKKIYIDPFSISDNFSKEKADLILITHPHYDHCSIADISKIAKDGTIIVAHAECQSKIAKINKKIEIKIIEPGQILNILGIKIEAFPAYNLGKEFHGKSEAWLGYILFINGKLFYHAGDTDLIPEMKHLAGKKVIALLPIGGKFTMDSEQASEAASLIKPILAIPMHWGAIIGEKRDAEKFVELCNGLGIKAEILEKE